jgi:mannose-6-phosphate isomerase-like protein (cupin superfamily)
MKRDTFLKTCVAAGALMSAPFKLMAKAVQKYRVENGFKVDSGKDRLGKSISLFEGDTFTCKVASKDTDGDIYVFESTRVKKGGPSLHYHFDQDEWWYILSGEFLFKVGEQTFTAKAGDSVFGPRKVPHTFSKLGEGEAKLLMFFQPAGKMEECFQKISQGIAKNMSEEEQDKFREAHGFKRVGPPLEYFKKL